MRHFLFLLIPFTLVSCREFYDEEFENKPLGVSEQEDRTYTTTIQSSDPNLSQLTGDARVDVDNGDVKINLSVSELPQNLNQIHYAYSASDCSSFSNTTVPVEVGSTRRYQINESLSTEALSADLKSSSAGDINLENKSLVVKGYSNLVEGANTPAFVIACGTLIVDDSVPDETTTTDDTTTTTPDDGTTVDDGTTLPPVDTTIPTGTEVPTF